MKLNCCVCLDLGSSFHEVKKESLITKLQYVAPEVNWSEDYHICNKCTSELKSAYKFRLQCLQQETHRQMLLIFACNDCNLTFTNKNTLIVHLKDHNISNNQSGTPTRKRIKPKKYKVSCEVCNIELELVKDVIDHTVTEHSIVRKNVKPYWCEQCHMRFTTCGNLIQHKKYHQGHRSHVCTICGKAYITKSDLTVHEYTHFNRRNYKCEFCPKAFNTNKNLRSHLFVVHSDPSQWKFQCDYCSKKFPLKSTYEQHVKRHTSDKQFVCHLCTKTFVSKTELQRHMNFHLNTQKVQCTLCGRWYKNERAHETHLAKEHGIGELKRSVRPKNFICHLCPASFSDRSKLERHFRVHSEKRVKPYACGQCRKCFYEMKVLRKHSKTKHSGNESVLSDTALKEYVHVEDTDFGIHSKNSSL